MKTNAIFRIILFSLALLFLLGILLTGLAAGYLVNNAGKISTSMISSLISGDSDEQTYEKNFWNNFTSGDTIDFAASVDAGKIRNISIDWVAGSITIQPGKNNRITISESEVSNDKNKLIWKQSGDKLVIQYCELDWNFLGINLTTDIRKDLVINVPADWICDSLEINTASAQVSITDLTIGELDFDEGSGSCHFKNCTVDEIDLDTASGDVHFSGELNVLDCDAASASINLVLTNVPKRIDLNTASGDLDLTLPENCGFSVSLDTMSGDFSSDFPTTMAAGNHLHGDGYCRINVTAMSGDVIIRKGK